jgi:hypothetical protein
LTARAQLHDLFQAQRRQNGGHLYVFDRQGQISPKQVPAAFSVDMFAATILSVDEIWSSDSSGRVSVEGPPSSRIEKLSCI